MLKLSKRTEVLNQNMGNMRCAFFLWPIFWQTDNLKLISSIEFVNYPSIIDFLRGKQNCSSKGVVIIFCLLTRNFIFFFRRIHVP